MGRKKAVSAILVAIAVIAAFIIVKAKAPSQNLSATQAIATKPTILIPSSSGTLSSGPSSGAHSIAAATPPPSLTANMKLSFDATFSGSSLNTSLWSTCYPWGTTNGCTNFSTVNKELEWYLPSQARVYNGALHLVAQHEPTSGTDKLGAPKEYECRSGMVTTYHSFQFEYGYVQVVAQIPYSKGLWSALWLAAANLKWPPEIDLMEHWGTLLAYHMYLHRLSLSSVLRGAGDVPNLSTGWHVISLSWTPTKLTWYIDGTAVMSTTTGVPQQPMYFIANLADDVAGPGTCSGTMLVQSVKIWTPMSQG